MRKNFSFLTICLLVIMSFASVAMAEQHICPSVAAIKQRINDKSLMKIGFMPIFQGNDRFYYGQYELADKFDTHEKWLFHFYVRSIDSPETKDQAWSLYRNLMDSLPNMTPLAADKGLGWECEYVEVTLGKYYYSVYVRLK